MLFRFFLKIKYIYYYFYLSSKIAYEQMDVRAFNWACSTQLENREVNIAWATWGPNSGPPSETSSAFGPLGVGSWHAVVYSWTQKVCSNLIACYRCIKHNMAFIYTKPRKENKGRVHGLYIKLKGKKQCFQFYSTITRKLLLA